MENWIYTNGVVWGKKKDSIAVANPELLAEVAKYSERIMVNIQGENEKLVDYLMRTKGAFQIIMKAITTLKESISTKWIEAHFVPTKLNLDHIQPTVDFLLNKMGVDRVSFLRFVSQGRGEIYKDLLELSASELLKVNKILMKLQKEYGVKKIRIGRPLNFGFLINSNEHPYSCRAGLDAPLIQPTGRIDMCPAWKMLPSEYSLGNLSFEGKGLREAWIKSPIVRKIRKINIATPEKLKSMLKGSCLKCRFFNSCKGRCVAQRILYWKSPYVTPDPLCPMRPHN